MNVLVLGSGGREHALAWKIRQSQQVDKLYVAPGNAGTGLDAENVALSLGNFAEIKNFIIENQVDILVVGPEQPLVDGIRDYFAADATMRELLVIGPSQVAAQLEGSKQYAKEFMQKAGIPTAAYRSFTVESIGDAKEFLKSLKPPYVLKADGLAAGKGVIIAPTYEEAVQNLQEMLLEKKFGEASSVVVIEEFLQGIEVSFFILTDGKNYVLLPEAKDYKKQGEGDTGLNTGGMGSVSPAPFVDEVLRDKVRKRIIEPTLKQLQKEQLAYVGFIFIGLMIVDGEPYVIEYNVRMGDPETESVMMRIDSDLVEAFQAMKNGKLGEFKMQISAESAACVMLTSGGYPGTYKSGYPIQLPAVLPQNMKIFHAGTKGDSSARAVTSGGRVMALAAKAESLQKALEDIYCHIDEIKYQDAYYRRDIGKDVLCK